MQEHEFEYASLDEVALKYGDPDRTESLAELVASLSPADQKTLMGDAFHSESTIHDWSFWGRPKQFVKDDPYFNVHLFLTGRGFGKTRAGAEWVRHKAMTEPGCRIGLLGRTAAEVRDIVVHGESGIMGIPQPEGEKPVFKPSEAAIYWPNGSYAKLFSAEKPDAVRGTQFHYFWADELAAYTPYVGPDGLTAFDNARLATRLGEKPTMIVTTTPKKVKILRDMIKEANEKGTIKIIRGKTDDNKSNLSSVYMDVVHGSFDGTAQARQELDGEMLDENPEGALWGENMIDHVHLTTEEAKRLPIRVVAVDPTVAKEPKDECGIVIIGATNEREMYRRNAYVLEDATLKASPEVWAQRVVEAFYEWEAHGIIVEKNQGHHLLTMALTNIDPTLEKKIFPVNAGQSKALRAEPVSQVYEQKRVKHVLPGMPLLEDQMVSWEPEISPKSPDRIDALVHGITAVMLKPPPGLTRRATRTVSASAHRLPGGLGTGRVRTMGQRSRGI